MRLKPIKPGMVIHCKNNEEYNELNKVIPLPRNSAGLDANDFVFYVAQGNVYWARKEDFDGEYIEFTDLIMPELSAEEEAYNKGLNDAWELAQKLWLPVRHGGINVDIVTKIFECDYFEIPKNFTPQEALAKIEAYEKEQAEIKVGDVVYADDEPEALGVVTWISNKLVYIMWGGWFLWM